MSDPPPPPAKTALSIRLHQLCAIPSELSDLEKNQMIQNIIFIAWKKDRRAFDNTDEVFLVTAAARGVYKAVVLYRESVLVLGDAKGSRDRVLGGLRDRAEACV